MRLISHGLARPPRSDSRTSSSPGSVLVSTLALQGQDLPGVLWSLGQRCPQWDLAGVRGEFDSGALVRSWPFRGTLHVVSGKDLGWILALTGQRTLAASARRRLELGLDSAALECARESASTALGSGPRSRTELLAAFGENGLRTDQGRGYHLLFALALEGLIVFSPFSGREQLLALAAHWLPEQRNLDSDEARRELVQRFIRGRGPASLADLSWWSKLPLRDLRPALQDLGDTVTEFTFQGTSLWADSTTIDSRNSVRAVVALPGFDEFLLGYQTRSAVLSPEHAPLTVPGNNGVFKPTVVHRGRVVGTWAKKTTSGMFDVLFHPFEPALSRAIMTGLNVEAQKLARFLGHDGPVDVGVVRE